MTSNLHSAAHWTSEIGRAVVDPESRAALERRAPIQRLCFSIEQLSAVEREALARPTNPKLRSVADSVGLRIACRDLALRLGLEGIDRPLSVRPLFHQGEVLIALAGENIEALEAFCEDEATEALAAPLLETRRAMEALEQEMQRFAFVTDVLTEHILCQMAEREIAFGFVGDLAEVTLAERFKKSATSRSDRCLDEWSILLSALCRRIRGSTSDLYAIDKAVRAGIEFALVRHAEHASPRSVTALDVTRAEWCRAVGNYRRTTGRHPVLRQARRTTKHARRQQQRIASARAALAVPLALFVLAAGVATYETVVVPRMGYQELSSDSLTSLPSIVEDGHIMPSENGGVFVGTLNVSHDDLTPAQVDQLRRQMLEAFADRDVRQVWLVDRHRATLIVGNTSGISKEGV